MRRIPLSGCFPFLFALFIPTAGSFGTVSAVPASERITVAVRETAGIRRFGYPVSAQIKLDPPAAPDTRFRLLHLGKPVVAQFRPLEHHGDRITLVALDFESNFMPNESREYVVEYSENVTPSPEPDRGMKADETDEAFLISNGPNLVWTIPKDLAALLRSVKTPKGDFLRPGSAGLAIRLKDNRMSRLSDIDKWRSKGTVVKQGPVDCALRFEATAISNENRGIACNVDLGFPRSKSWVSVTWSIDDPKGLVAGLQADLNLQVGDGPTLVDFGAGSLVYAALPEGQVAVLQAGSRDAEEFTTRRGTRPFWATFRGRPDALEPYVTGAPGGPTVIEGWAHVMDRQRCTALAVDKFANRSLDRMEVSSDGRVQISRDIGIEKEVVAPGPKKLAFWVHFVPFPPHVGAVTSPQSMQSPLDVQCTPSSTAIKGPVQKSSDDAANAPNESLSHEIDALSRRAKGALAITAGEISLSGLKEPVQVLRDRWGVPHIYAQNPHDLFFAQGFVQAQDRLWQMELWRRANEGKLAEISGPDGFERDRFARLIEYRGDMEEEWTSYGPDARMIIESFVRGVNAFIEHCQDNLPIEFQLTGLKPEPWTPRVCLGRMAGFIMCRNAANEVLRAQLVSERGADQAARLIPIDPYHKIQLPGGPELDGIDQRIVSGINAVNAPIRVPVVESVGNSRAEREQSPVSAMPCAIARAPIFLDISAEAVGEVPENSGSNNWTIAGRLTTTGKPILANDPHRPITLPSLRYLVHLNCPPSVGQNTPTTRTSFASTKLSQGWNVIGGTEPALPGVAIGHNERIAWGMTIVGTDQADVFVEETHADDPDLYLVASEWRPMRIEREPIRVRGESEPRMAELKFTRHGPVIFQDRDRHRAYALRWAGSEPGTAGYMGALAIDRARNWHEFLDAAARWKVPSENLVYADVDGHIGWIAAALTPIRTGYDGLLPVLGATGQYEWTGFLSTAELPQRFDPPEGYIATANHNILPPRYRHALGYEWSAPFRFQRIDDVLRRQIEKGARFSIEDSERLQHDATSIPARRLLALLRQAKLDDAPQPTASGNNSSSDRGICVRTGLEILSRWDGVLSRDSAAAALYIVWQHRLTERLLKPRVPEKLWERYSSRSPVLVVLDLLEQSDVDPRSSPDFEPRAILWESLSDAVAEVSKRLGPDPSDWHLGKLHEAHFKHMLDTALKGERGEQLDQTQAAEGTQSQGEAGKDQSLGRRAIAAVFNLPSVPRAGDAHAPIATGGPNYQQSTGASYRQVIDLADWDRSVASSVPGQSGQPTSPHYGDLLPLWERGEYFPLAFSRAAVETVVTEKLVLVPRE